MGRVGPRVQRSPQGKADLLAQEYIVRPPMGCVDGLALILVTLLFRFFTPWPPCYCVSPHSLKPVIHNVTDFFQLRCFLGGERPIFSCLREDSSESPGSSAPRDRSCNVSIQCKYQFVTESPYNLVSAVDRNSSPLEVIIPLLQQFWRTTGLQPARRNLQTTAGNDISPNGDPPPTTYTKRVDSGATMPRSKLPKPPSSGRGYAEVLGVIIA